MIDLEYYHNLFNALPEEQKDLFNTCFKLQNAYDATGSGSAYQTTLKKISRLSGISFDVLDKAFLDTYQGTDYNLEWLKKAGYDVPQFMFDWKEAVRKFWFGGR